MLKSFHAMTTIRFFKQDIRMTWTFQEREWEKERKKQKRRKEKEDKMKKEQNKSNIHIPAFYFQRILEISERKIKQDNVKSGV